jgi:tetratricopeptide (TPR) repeat protein
VATTNGTARSAHDGKPAQDVAPEVPPALAAQNILAAAQEGRFVIEEFRPLVDSIEWELGQQYLGERGSRVFLSDSNPIPFVINNDGLLSQNAAEVFFSSLVEAEKAGPLEKTIYVLELGIGLGLFARFFLDALKHLCRKHGKDYYQRLRYVAADRHEKMLADAARNGIFENHTGHYLFRVVDGFEPETYLRGDTALPAQPPYFRAVFLNYVLDCLPAADLKVEDNTIRQLYVRTCLARNIDLAEYTTLSPQDLLRRARSARVEERRDLLELYGLFASEYDYREVRVEDLPYGEFALDYGRQHTQHFLHNYGAIKCLEKLLGLLHHQGFILVNDYGQTQVTKEVEFEHQRFSSASFVGLNFPLLKEYLEGKKICQWVEPSEDSAHIYSRMLGKSIPDETAHEFTDLFSKTRYEWVHQPWNLSRAFLQSGRIEAALGAYHEALERQPYNWLLMNEIALFLIFTLRNHRAGREMIKTALSLNPRCSAELWNTLGEAYYETGLNAEAEAAYRQGIMTNPKDVKSRYNLSWTLVRRRQYREALAVLAEALALEETGEFYDRLLKKQAEVLSRLNSRNQQRQLLLANRVSRRTPQGESSSAKSPTQDQKKD